MMADAYDFAEGTRDERTMGLATSLLRGRSRPPRRISDRPMALFPSACCGND